MNYLIYGNSFNLINKEIERILKGRGSTSFSLEDVSLKNILEDVGYASMFDDEKIIILKNFEVIAGAKKDDEVLKSLEAYLSEPNEKTIIIFTSKEKAKANLKGIVSKLKVIETPFITKPYELAKIFGPQLRGEGYFIAQNALDVFCEKCAYNYDIAMSEFKKLASIKGFDKNITMSDIENIVSNYNMTDSFGFKDALINLNVPKALEMLDDLEAAKMEVIKIVVMMAKEYIAIYNIKLLVLQRMNDSQISSEMGGMNPYRVKLLRAASTKYDLEKLERAILYLCNLDLRLISQDNLGYDELRKFFLEIL